MGFVFNGSGFNRRTYALTVTNPRNAAAFSRAPQPLPPPPATFSQKPPVATDGKRPVPAGSSDGAEHGKRAKATHSGGTAVSRGAGGLQGAFVPAENEPRHTLPRRAVLTISSAPAHPSPPPTLVDLPPEILYRVFCFAGLGSANRLAHTCSYLHGLLDFTRNDYLLEKLVRSCLLLDLAKGTRTRDWVLRFAKRYADLPENVRGSPALEAAFHVPVRAAATTRAIDSTVFSFPGMGGHHVRFLHLRFGGIAVARRAADRQRKLKRRYLEWRYMVFKAFVALAIEDPDTPAQVLLTEAEALEQCAQYMTAHGLGGFEPLVESGAVPGHLYRAVGPASIETIRELGNTYGMRVGLPAPLVASFYRTNADVGFPGDLLDVLFLLAFEKSATDREIADALAVYCWLKDRADAGHAVPGFLHAFGRYHDFVIGMLTIYFSASADENSSGVWDRLKQAQIPELLDHVVGLGVSVPLHIF
ncbi:hypothetical protein METBIDRAFT_10844 [Metschnikowia bicuspidata var. bicuspidata NRRL YB-4993]|uniref:F-box domain-containing protein n=1 Tax=Metschnikowia bicuspidata var. bicuspidata NRRL YB-4993 TaxID=869754 RepID=A0A1A0HDC2_9ASCO|nr:hypothetical protein METBIDRAFT_10844 [Metschnikowia bicuspidata var. bicuspidata NRRL YB-4993]OBA21928.1 hypothetical protein METBIDRAFT_10844 [Metschnikowia bicuspidata var. bicuspidata NRRL YB-4993]